MEIIFRVETHYDFMDAKNHLLKSSVRDTCSEAQINVLAYVMETLYPGMDFEIYYEPAGAGSFKDFKIVKFFNKNPGIISAAALAVPTIFSFLTYSDQAKANKVSSDNNRLEIIEKCKSFGIDELKLNEICDSYYPIKQRNNFYESLKKENDIIKINSKVFSSSTTFINKTIKKEDFDSYIQAVPKEKEFLKQNNSGNIELSQPYIAKQKQYGRGVSWKGIYYGEDIYDLESGSIIIEDGEDVFFYMQDNEYKNQVLNQDIVFKNSDNIGVIFDIGRYYDYLNKKFGRPRLYITKVVSHNDNLVEHKRNLDTKKEKANFEEKNKEQGKLFS